MNTNFMFSAVRVWVLGGLLFSTSFLFSNNVFSQYPGYYGDESVETKVEVESRVLPPSTLTEKEKLLKRVDARVSRFTDLNDAPDAEIIAQAYAEILEHYAFAPGELTPEMKKKLVNGAVSGMVDALGDDYSEYIVPSDIEETEEMLEGNYEGIGAFIEQQDNLVMVTTPLRGGPADRAGVRPGDVIISVDDVSSLGKTAKEVGDEVRGKAGTVVTLGILRDEEELEISVVRGSVELPSVTFDYLDVNGRQIPSLHLHQFNSQTLTQTKKTIAGAMADNDFKEMVLDLRLNPGGYVRQAVGVSELFLSPGDELFSVKYADGEINYTADEEGILSGVEHVIILIDEGTASSAEMLITAIAANKKTTLIGQDTFGKGIVQSFFGLGNGGVIKLTNARWYAPDESWIHKSGIKPDIYHEFKEEDNELLDILDGVLVQ